MTLTLRFSVQGTADDSHENPRRLEPPVPLSGMWSPVQGEGAAGDPSEAHGAGASCVPETRGVEEIAGDEG